MMKSKKVRVVSCSLAAALSLGAASAMLAACGGKSAADNETTPLTMASDLFDGVFNPFFYTSGPDGEVVAQTQIGMLSSDENGQPVAGDDEPCVAKAFSVVTTGSKDTMGDTGTSADYDTYHTDYYFAINNDITFSVPYLLAEDFSNIIQFDYDCNVGTGTSSSSAGNKDAHLLSDKGAIGWTAARVGGETGKCIRSSCRFEGGGVGKASSYARYPGRIDSPPVSGIKSGKTVRVRVSFDYVGGQDSWMMDSNKNKGGTYGNPTFNYGYTANSGQPNGGDNLENPVEAEDIALETDKSWNTPLSNWNTKTFLADFNSAHRISWKVNVNRIGNVSSWSGIFGANGNHYLYLDNIKVSIVNE